MKLQKWCRWSLPLIILALVVGCGSDDDGPTAPPQVTDWVWVDSVTAVANSQAKVNINMHNSTELSGVMIPLRLSGTGFTIDSGSYVGGLFSNALVKVCSIDVVTQTVFLIGGMDTDTDTLASGEGIFASLYVSLAPEAAGQEIAIDSARVMYGQDLLEVVFVTPDLTPIMPAFEPGKIVVAPSADLALTNLTVAPSTVTTRAFTACSFYIANNGPTALSSEYIVVDYYLSADDTFSDTGDVKIGDTGFTASIASGMTAQVDLSSTGLSNMVSFWPVNQPTGDYYVFARVTISSLSPNDPDSSNNYDRTNSTILYSP